MRYVYKPKNSPKELLSQEVMDSLLEIIKTKTKPHKIIKPSLYQGENDKGEKIVVQKLLSLYHYKCAYCERYIGLTSIEIEHYRPKSKYYWLCYEWTNLLSSCHYCNKIGSGKGVKFPLMATRKRILTNDKKDYKADSQYLLDERPYLLHPEIDKPENFFKFDNEGKMFGTDKEKRGEKTIQICNLNSYELKRNRQEIVIDVLLTDLKKVLASYDERVLDISGVMINLKITFDRMKEEQNIKFSFSLMRKYVFENFETLIVPLFIHRKQREILTVAFQLYNKRKL
jgi:uncharacterized protein (TIGR02646 family)